MIQCDFKSIYCFIYLYWGNICYRVYMEVREQIYVIISIIFSFCLCIGTRH